jgi:pyruvate dehydrogenase E2 component (dihydrolipoamide acetyltransferase)
MTTSAEVTVPDLGGFADVPVIEVHVSPGDVVAAEDPLITLESDKATMDIPAPAAGTVRELRVSIGDRVEVGQLILLMDGDEAPVLADQPSAGEDSPASDRQAETAAAATVDQYEPATASTADPTEAARRRRPSSAGG